MNSSEINFIKTYTNKNGETFKCIKIYNRWFYLTSLGWVPAEIKEERSAMTSREMQKLSAAKRWAKLTPEQRSAWMSKVRDGASKPKKLTPTPALGGKPI